jgi:uncharacterized protein (DUF362 family)
MTALTRRGFLKRTAAVGAASLMGERIIRGLVGVTGGSARAAEIPDLVAVKGSDPFAATLSAVEGLGGMARFVSPGDRVGLLVNSPFKHKGASVDPAVTLAVMAQCRDAGAKEIRYLKDPHRGYWERTPLAARLTDLIDGLKPESGRRREVAIEKGLALKKAKVTEDLFGCDVFINVSITKHHKGVHYSGALKNMMGLCPFSTNSYFHFGTLEGVGWYEDVHHLSQCIADLNLVRPPDLCLSDATAFITENGPYGPGPLTRLGTVVATHNAVALDAYCCGLLGLAPTEVLMIQKAAAHGLGPADVKRLRIDKREV